MTLYRSFMKSSLICVPVCLLGCGTVGSYYPKPSAPASGISQATQIQQQKSNQDETPTETTVAAAQTDVAASSVEPTTQQELPAAESSVEILPVEFQPAPAADPQPLVAEEPKGVPLPAPAAGEMTLAQLEDIALSNNPTLALQQAEVDKERGNWKQVGMYPNPTVGYLNSSASSNGSSQENGVLLQQTFITGGKLDKARATETYGIQSTKWQLEAQRMRVVNDVRLRYIDVLGVQQQIKILQELVALSQEALDAARQLVKAQQAARTDVLQAEAQYETIRMALDNAHEAYQGAWRRLAVIVGRPEMPPAHLAEPDEDLPEFNLDAEWQRMLAQSPLLRTSEAQVGIARGQLAVAEAAPIPDLTVQFVGSYDSINDFGKFSTLVALPLPIVNRNQGGIYNAASEVHRAQRELQRTQLVMRDLIVSSYRDYMLARNEVQGLRDEILPRLKENLELTIKGYREGQFAILEVINAQQSSFQTNLDYIDALNRARKRTVEIEGLHLIGGLNPATIGTAIQEVGAGGRLRAVQQLLQQQGGANLGNFAPAALQ